MRLIAIGDIHGCLPELKELMEVIKPTPNDRLVFMGDYIDRGPDSVGVVKYLFTEIPEVNAVRLMGNHEAIFLYDYEVWRQELGHEAILSMERHGIEASHALLKNCLKQTVFSHAEAGHVFVHGGLRDEGLDLTPKEEILQLRGPHAYRGKIPIVVGHTPVVHAVRYEKAINVDSGCFISGVLSGYDLLNDVLYTNRGIGRIRCSQEPLPEP